MIARPLFRASRLCCRCYATSTPTTPPMLLKIRKDMKTAMQNKDSNRLAVLRALLTSTLNASKTSNPITTDMQILALIRKNAAASRAASEEFKGAGRADLAEKEENQLKIMEEYTASVKLMGQDEIRSTVKMIVDTMRGDGVNMHMGDVLKTVFAPEVLGNAAVEKAEVTKIVKEVLAEA